MRAPNILYIHSHDTGVEIAPYGAAVDTPALDAFAQRATRFTRAFAVAPTCSPSRAGLLTGQYPHEVGMTGLAHRGFAWDDYRRHLAHHLSRADYATALCGVQHVAPQRTMIGYDEYLDGNDGEFGRDYFDVPGLNPVEHDQANARRAAEWIVRRGAASQAEPARPGATQAGLPNSRPWFLSVGFLATHRPFPGAGTTGMERTVEEDRAAYRRSAEELDRSVGIVLAAVERGELWESTVVVFTTDHGVPFPGHKGELRDAGTRVALMVWIPAGATGRGASARVAAGAARTGGVCDQLVSQIDLFPTLLELAGVSRDSQNHDPAPWAARSLLPVMAGRYGAVRDAVYAESNYHAAYEPARSIRTARYRLTTRPADALSRAPANVDDCPEKELLRPTGWFDRDHAGVELYDLVTDPEETVNVAEDSRYGAIREELNEQIRQWMHGTGDPALSGVVEAPPGAQVDSASRWSPS
ncbi:MAG TPA: sulfatase [Alkalispirochaeta sp.]|nr:sulfatase [Alkalispirochaeta sp.]